MTLAVDVIEKRGPSNEIRRQLQSFNEIKRQRPRLIKGTLMVQITNL